MRDIENRADIEQLMHLFYSKALKDDEIGHFFTEVVPLDLSHHIPVITSFWENILFATGGYKGNPMQKHVAINQLSSLDAKHFERWLKLFSETVDASFQGDNARLIKERALSIATVMRIKCS